MLAIPLEGLGSIGALWLRGMAWSPPVLWGMVVLAGVVLSNSILMIDKVLQLRARGVERGTAIVAASTLRLRPVLMTALAAGAAMFPIAISPPPATEQFRNIATAISGGLVTSTLMTLIVIPVAYSIMDDFLVLLKRFYLGAPDSVEVTPEATVEATEVVIPEAADETVAEVIPEIAAELDVDVIHQAPEISAAEPTTEPAEEPLDEAPIPIEEDSGKRRVGT